LGCVGVLGGDIVSGGPNDTSVGEISVKTGNNARNGGKNSLNRLIRCVCGKKIGPDPRNFNQRVSLGRNDLLIRTFLKPVAIQRLPPFRCFQNLIFALNGIDPRKVIFHPC
ncbi:hypothetical protein, partial [Citrobacter freundii]|uniref:hypothetical protein n=6 Tax=Bacteria TaxID=2 RepID=UPI001CE2C59D